MKINYLKAASAFAAWATFATTASAQPPEPCGDDVCPAGYTCELTTYDTCFGGCAPSLPGEPAECQEAECETVSYESCHRAACETDEDCGDEMKCHSFVSISVPAAPAPCPPGVECDPIEPAPPPEPVEYKQCTPRSELPCEVNTDCGEGYDCVPAVSCTCGSTPTPTPSPGQPAPDAPPGALVAPPPGELPLPPDEGSGGGSDPSPPDDCTCEPSGTNYCQMQQLDCETDSDCPTDWSCIQGPSSCWADSEGNSGCDESAAQCYPSNQPGPVVPPTPGGTPTSGDGDEEGEPQPPAPGPVSPGPVTNPPGGNHGGGGGHGTFAFWGCSLDNVGLTSKTSPWALLSVALGATFLRRRRRAS